MQHDLEEKLADAARTGEALTVLYMGGSQPGSKRDIHVVAVEPPYVKVRDFFHSELRTYRLDRVHLVSRDHAAPAYSPLEDRRDAFECLDDLARTFAPCIRAAGFHVEASPEGLTAHRVFKNGRPMKGVEFGIVRNEKAGFGQRPYRVLSNDGDGRTYSRLDRAALTLIDAAADAGVDRASLNQAYADHRGRVAEQSPRTWTSGQPSLFSRVWAFLRRALPS